MFNKKTAFIGCIFAGLFCSSIVVADPAPVVKQITWTLSVETANDGHTYSLAQNGAVIPKTGWGLYCTQNPVALTTNSKYEFVSISCDYSAGKLLFSTRCDRYSSNSNVALLIVNHAFGNVTLSLNCSNIQLKVNYALTSVLSMI